MLLRPTDEELLERYSEALVVWQDLQDSGASIEEVNAQYDLHHALVMTLRKRGPDSRKKLVRLLDHPYQVVRGTAAFWALEFLPEAAIPVLEEIAANPERPSTGINAWAALQHWKNGSLDFTQFDQATTNT